MKIHPPETSRPMNKISNILFRLVMLPSPQYRRLGINTGQLALILRYKLTMDDRHPNTFQQTQASRKKEGISKATYGTMLMAFLMGFLYLVFLLLGSDQITHLFFFFSAYLFMLASMLISDFTSVLIDVRDNMIILPKPVNDRTVLMAKLLHIIVHMSRIVFPMSLPGFVLVFINLGWWQAICLLLVIILSSLFAIFLINAAYLLVLKITTPEKFKSFIAWFQIGFAILLYGGYQLVPRVSNIENFQLFSITETWYAKFLPPYWFAGAWEFLAGYRVNSTWIWFFLAIASTIFSTWLVIRYLAPAFNRKLAMIAGSNADETGGVRSLKPSSRGYAASLASLFTMNEQEKAGFLFSWKWTARNREFKLRVYPTIGYILVWVVISFYKVILNEPDFFSGGSDSKIATSFLVLIYFSSFILINAIHQVNHSDQYKASWIFFSTPLKSPGDIVLGSFKSIICKFFLPLAIVLMIAGMILVGPVLLPNLVLGLSNQLVICAVVLLSTQKKLPASLPVNTNRRGGAFLQGLLLMVIFMVAGGLHFLVYRFMPVVILLAILSSIAAWLVFRKIGSITWEEIKTV
jgi:ABC-2 type transport system permease protein